jgi:hypothetical protein
MGCFMPFLQKINKTYFNNELSADVLELLAPIEHERPEVHQWLERMSSYMQQQCIGARDFSEGTAWLIATFVPKLLPGAWNGAVPPITLKGRHARVDHYLASNPWNKLESGGKFLDLGCGFPPETTIDSAATFSDIQVVGADPSFGRYLIKDADNNYAGFNADRELLYFQPESFSIDRWEAMFADPDATRLRYLGYLEQARPELPGDPDSYQKWQQGDIVVEQNPIIKFETDNLKFVQQGIGSGFSDNFDAIRCFNVLIYFNREFREQALRWAPTQLKEEGIFIAGVNWAHSRAARHSVYQCQDGQMAHREFAISIDNLRPLEIVPWFTLHDDDYDTLAMVELVRVLRSDQDFIRPFDQRMDQLLGEHDFCARKDNGYLGGLSKNAGPEAMDSIPNLVNTGLQQDGFVEVAVDVLNNNGFEAWVNCAGHIAINPAALNA